MDTALAIISVVNYPSILLATLVLLLAPVIPVVLFFYPPAGNWVMAGTARNATSTERWRTAAVWTPLVLLYIWSITPSMFLALGCLFLYRHGERRQHRSKKTQGKAWLRKISHLGWHLLPSLSVILIFMPLIFSPWVPLERVRLTADAEVTGYLIGTQENYSLFIDTNKNALWIDIEEIKNREVCEEPKHFLYRPFLAQGPKTASC